MSWFDFLQNLSDMILEGLYLKDELRGDTGEGVETGDLDAFMHRVADAGGPIGLVQIDPRTAVLRGVTLVAGEMKNPPSFLDEVDGPTPPADIHRVPTSLPGVAELRGTSAGNQCRLMMLEDSGWVFVVYGESLTDVDSVAQILAQVLNDEAIQ